MTAFDTLRRALAEAARSLGAPDGAEPVLERPRDPAFGDWTTNYAMVLARPLKRKPAEIARDLVAHVDLVAAGVRSAEIVGPGFLNFRLETGAQAAGLLRILGEGTAYGHSKRGGEAKVNVEFVSANPTGPLHVGHGRQAALGDAIAALLGFTGWDVSREFYYNDAGVQIENLAASVDVRLRQLEGTEAAIPEGGYNGEYIREIALRYRDQESAAGGVAVASGGGDRTGALREFAVRALRAEQDLDLKAFGVRFDTYYLESSLYTDGKVEQTVEMLRRGGHTFEQDGALWLRTTDFGDDKDRVMQKRDGTYTYFVPDVAYHVTKWERGFRRAVNVQGADHHSTVTRVRAGLQALGIGIPAAYPEYVLHQLVTVLKGGEEVKISKRAGSYVTVRDLIDDVGRDAVRYFFVMRKGDSQLVFDIDLARSQSEDNPVYYIQMQHARMSGIFRTAGIGGASIDGAGVDLSVLAEPLEGELIKALLDWPSIVAGAADSLEPHRVATYLLETARKASKWYHEHHVLGEPAAITAGRLVLARATQIVLATGLTLLGISAPERM
ncbi:MAG: arginine--tRNA ligase [Gemmatimonadaceae bacterium]